MNSFYDQKTKKGLQDAKSKIQAITTVYNMELSNLQQSELIYADVLTKYSQLLIMEVMTAGSVQNSMASKHRKHVNEEILRYIKDKYKIAIPAENVDVAIEGARERSTRVFELIERYKSAVHEAYLSFDDKLRYCSNIAGIKALSHTVKENRYMNMIVDGVYASSEYDTMIAFMGKTISGGLEDRDGFLVYSSNPFSISQSGKTKLQLKKPIYMYSVDAFDFMPSVCLELIHGSRADGSDIYFPDLRFDGEWVTKAKEVPCECEELDYIPASFLKNYQILYNDSRVKIETKDKNRQEYTKYLSELVKKGKLHSVNEELGINPNI